MRAVRLRAATRGSALARWQTDHVAALLAAAGAAIGATVTVEPVVVETVADVRLDIPIWEMGGKGVFVKEVQAAVLDGRADLAVHSGKDLPALTPAALRLAAVPERGDPRDVLIGSDARRSAAWCGGGHRFGAPSGPVGVDPSRPHLRRSPGQHRHPARRRPTASTPS